MDCSNITCSQLFKLFIYSIGYWGLVQMLSSSTCSSFSYLLIIHRWVFSVVLLTTKTLCEAEPYSVGLIVTGVVVEETNTMNNAFV